MIHVKAIAYRVTIPVSALLVVWVGVGRALFGVLGWGFLFLMFLMGPILLAALCATSTLAITQHRPAEGHLTTPQFWALLTVWVGLAGFGFFVVDVADYPRVAGSVFTSLTGLTDTVALDASHALTDLTMTVAVVAYSILLGLLMDGQRGRRERRAATLAKVAPFDPARFGIMDRP